MAGYDQVRGNFCQRDKHKEAVVEAWVRDIQPVLIDDQVLVHQHVEIERARAPPLLLRAIATEVVLDGEQLIGRLEPGPVGGVEEGRGVVLGEPLGEFAGQRPGRADDGDEDEALVSAQEAQEQVERVQVGLDKVMQEATRSRIIVSMVKKSDGKGRGCW